MRRFRLRRGDWWTLAREVAATSIRGRPTGLRRLARDARAGRLLSIPLELCLNQYAFSYGPGGWSYLVDLARELLARSDIGFRETRFYRFVQGVRAPLCSDLMGLHDPAIPSALVGIPHGSFPWGHFDARVRLPADGWLDLTPIRASQTCMWSESGAGIDPILEREVEATRSLVVSLRDRGYHLGLARFGLPPVSPLVARDGTLRFVQQDGAHRLASLAALGYERTLVRLDPDRYPAIREEDVDRWHYVQRGLLSRAEALRFFRLYFELDGRERRDAVPGAAA